VTGFAFPPPVPISSELSLTAASVTAADQKQEQWKVIIIVKWNKSNQVKDYCVIAARRLDYNNMQNRMTRHDSMFSVYENAIMSNNNLPDILHLI